MVQYAGAGPEPPSFLFEGKDIKVKSSGRRTDILIKAQDRFTERIVIEKALRAVKLKFKVIPAGPKGLSSSVPTTTFMYQDHFFRVGYKPKGGGSGAGADATRLGESAQCLYLAAVQHKKSPIKDAGYVAKNYKAFSEYFDTDEKISLMLHKLGEDWVESSMIIANFLINDPTSKMKIGRGGKKYVFHRGSKLVDEIDEIFAFHNKKLTNGKFQNINKWSPADIWAAREGFKMPKKESFKTLEGFNNWLLKQFKKRDLVGISLKKANKAAHADLFNVGEARRTVEYVGYQIRGGNKSIFDSKDATIIFKLKGSRINKIQFRSFTKVGSWQSEIKGPNANLGKFSGGGIDQLLHQTTKRHLTPSKTVIRAARNPTSTESKKADNRDV